MNPSQIQLIELIAKKIADQSLINQWPYFMVLVLLVVITASTGAWLGAYFAKRGEARAITAGFDELRMQLAKNTETVETVKAEIAHGDWATREYKTQRRSKLEELVTLMTLTSCELKKASGIYVFGTKDTFDELHGAKIYSIVRIYFPELADEAVELRNEFELNVIHLMGIQRDLLDLDLRAANEYRSQHMHEWQERYRLALVANKALLDRALDLAENVVKHVN